MAWAIEKFHHFLYAKHFILETDQKLLEVILSKSLNQATPRLQWILIRTFAYHFTVKYIPDVTNQIADCLSWLGGQRDTIKLPKLHIHQIITHFMPEMIVYKMAAQEDDELALLTHTIMTGWPSTIREVLSEIQPYWTFREELTMEGGIVLKGTHTVIPHKKHQAILNIIHEGQLGVSKCKFKAKDTVYWPSLNDQLKKLVLNCELWLK